MTNEDSENSHHVHGGTSAVADAFGMGQEAKGVAWEGIFVNTVELKPRLST